ncbi:MAG: hypothetical protein MJ181_00910 [Treponema sp.]|nr:hypothetical protein [Treponema sp.]
MKSDNDKYPVMTPEEFEWELMKLTDEFPPKEITKQKLQKLREKFSKLYIKFLLQGKTAKELDEEIREAVYRGEEPNLPSIKLIDCDE